MHRRTLILRRFGALTFGLGYFEGGTWVDHTTLPDRGASLGVDGTSIEAVHTLLDCCRQPVAPTMPLRIDPAGIAQIPIDRSTHVDAIARRSSAR
jgi:hypothetical protein